MISSLDYTCFQPFQTGAEPRMVRVQSFIVLQCLWGLPFSDGPTRFSVIPYTLQLLGHTVVSFKGVSPKYTEIFKKAVRK